MSTTSHNVAGNAYTDLGAGPMTIIADATVRVLIYSAAASPVDDADAASVFLKPGEPLNYQYSDKLHIKLGGATTATAPIRVIK